MPIPKTILESLSGFGTGTKAGAGAYEAVQDLLKTYKGQASKGTHTILGTGQQVGATLGIPGNRLKAAIMAGTAGVGIAVPVIEALAKRRVAAQAAAKSNLSSKVLLGAILGGGGVAGGAMAMNALSGPSMRKTSAFEQIAEAAFQDEMQKISGIKDIVKKLKQNKGKAAIGAAGLLGGSVLLHHAKRKLNKEMYGGQMTPTGWRNLK